VNKKTRALLIIGFIITLAGFEVEYGDVFTVVGASLFSFAILYETWKAVR
jgi:hypothetical protein